MKKILALILAIGMALSIGANVYAEENDSVTVTLDDTKIEFPDAKPFIDSRSRTLVPIRFVSEAMGAVVNWENETQTVVIVKDADTIRYTIGQPLAYLNDEMMTFDSFGILKDDRTFVPLRFISELLMCDVNWVSETKTVKISSPGAAIKFPEPKLTVHYPESEFDKRLFWITLDNYREFQRNCPYYEFKIEFITPTEFNSFEQDEGAINGWQQYSRNEFVSLTNTDSTIESVGRAFYTTRALKNKYKPKEGEEIKYKLTVHRRCSDETKEYTYTEILKMPYSLIEVEE